MKITPSHGGNYMTQGFTDELPKYINLFKGVSVKTITLDIEQAENGYIWHVVTENATNIDKTYVGMSFPDLASWLTGYFSQPPTT
jgi:hypothetical protein